MSITFHNIIIRGPQNAHPILHSAFCVSCCSFSNVWCRLSNLVAYSWR